MDFLFDPNISAEVSGTFFNVLFALLLSLFIAWIYKKTHQGISYSQTFVFTLVMLTILTATTMMVIGSSVVRAVILLGAFTIIRFRTAVKDTKDIAFIFWALVSGMAAGSGAWAVGAVSTLLLGIVIAVLTRLNFGRFRFSDYVVHFTADPSLFSAESLRKTFAEYLKDHSILNVYASEGGKRVEYTINVRFIKDNSEETQKFLKELSKLPGVLSVDFVSTKDDIEY